MEEENTIATTSCILSDALNLRPQLREVSNSIQVFSWELTSFWKLRYTSEGAVSHTVLYYHQLSIARNQVSF